MAKYERLQSYLARQPGSEVPMSFEQIERVIDAPLPPSASKHRAWWSNNPSNSVITHAWLDAGFKTAGVDMGSRRLVFRRARDDASSSRAGSGTAADPLSMIHGGLKGSVRVNGDLTLPFGERWAAETDG